MPRAARPKVSDSWWLAVALSLAACTTRPEPELEAVLPSALGLTELTLEQRGLLRATVEITGVLSESALRIAPDLSRVTGTFSIAGADGKRRAPLALRLYGRFSPTSEEVLLAMRAEEVTLQPSGDSRVHLASEYVSEGSAIFDRNRNGTSNLADLRGGVDPGPAGVFLVPSTTSLQLQPVSAGGGNQVIAIENRSSRAVHVDVDVLGVPGAYVAALEDAGVSLGNRFGRSVDLGEVAPFGTRFLAVSFTPPTAFLTTGALLVRGVETTSSIAQSQAVTLIGNTAGTLQPIPEGYAAPAAPTQVEGLTVVPFPVRQLFSGMPVSSVDPEAPSIVPLAYHGGSIAGVPTDAAFYLEVPAGYRFYAWLSGLAADVDLTLIELDAASAPIAASNVSSAMPGTSPERVELPHSPDQRRVLLLLGIIEPTYKSEQLTGLPFSLTAQVLSGPEFAKNEPLSPAEGPEDGGNRVRLSGSGFAPGALVRFGARGAPVVAADAAGTSLEVIAPAAVLPQPGSNPVAVSITNPGGGSAAGESITLPNAYVYRPPAPRIDQVIPGTVSTAGSTLVRIVGAALSGDDRAPTVTLGGTPAASITWVSDTELLVVAPARAAGSADLVVTTHLTGGASVSGSRAAAVTYVAPSLPAPTLVRVEPDVIGASAGAVVTLTGSGFVGTSAVTFGGVAAADVDVIDGQTLEATAPVLAPGLVSVTVQNPDAQAATLTDALVVLADCAFLPGGCGGCGNGRRDASEQCDGIDLASQTCLSRGFDGGTLRCDADCSFDLSSCTRCGNGGREPGEECEGSDLAGESCVTLGFASGRLLCASDCTFDSGECNDCGNGLCSQEETFASCEADCAPGCGDNSCAFGESCTSCPHDCSCARPFTVTVVAGEGSHATIGQAGAAVVVQVKDATAAPLAGVRVEFSAEAGVHLVAPQAITDANGRAGTGFTASLVPGAHDIVVRAFEPDDTPIPGTPLSVGVVFDDVARDTLLTVVNKSRTQGAGLATTAARHELSLPEGLAIDSGGTLYIADTGNHRVLAMSPAGAMRVVAGTGAPGFSGDGGAADGAQLSSPAGLHIDASGNLFIVDRSNERVRQVTPGGVITTVAGGGAGADGSLATDASLPIPQHVTTTSDGSLYVVDVPGTDWRRLRRVRPDFVIETVLDTATSDWAGLDGLTTLDDKVFVHATGDYGGTFAYWGRGALLRQDTPGVFAVAGGSQYGGSDLESDGPIGAVLLQMSGRYGPMADGSLLISSAAYNTRLLWRATPASYAQLISGGPNAAFSGDLVPRADGRYSSIGALASNARGDVFVVDTDANCVRMIRGATSTLARYTVSLSPLGAGQSVAPSAPFTQQAGVRVATPDGLSVGVPVSFAAVTRGLFIASPSVVTNGAADALTSAWASRRDAPQVMSGTVRSFTGATTTLNVTLAADPATPANAVVSVVNTAAQSGTLAQGPASQVRTSAPVGLALDATGVLYFGQGTETLARVDLDGMLELITAPNTAYHGMTIDSAGNLYVAITGPSGYANMIYELDAGGVWSLHAGTGTYGCAGTAALASDFRVIEGLVSDGAGGLVLVDSYCQQVRHIDAGGNVSTVYTAQCGTNGTYLLQGGVTVGADGAIYFTTHEATGCGSDIDGGAIYRYDGALTRYAGGSIDADDQPATSAQLSTGGLRLAMDGPGNVYVSEFARHRIRRIDATTGIITTLVGGGSYGAPAGAVEPRATTLTYSPQQVAVGPDGAVYYVDYYNYTIRRVVQ